MPSVFQDICDFGIAVSVTARFPKADFDVAVTVSVHKNTAQSEGFFQLSCGTAGECGSTADDRCQVATHLFQNDFAAALENRLRNCIGPAAEQRQLFQKIIRHLNIHFSHVRESPSLQESQDTFRAL